MLDYLMEWAKADQVSRESHRVLTAEEVGCLAEGGLIEVGAHSVTHPSLAALCPEAQEEEIRKSKCILEEILHGPVKSFAYPFGRSQDYAPVTARLIREAGFNCACTTSGYLLGQLSDPFELPRYTVPAGDGEQFARWLTKIFDE